MINSNIYHLQFNIICSSLPLCVVQIRVVLRSKGGGGWGVPLTFEPTQY